jgi:sugar lactone lactonase YvrE
MAPSITKARPLAVAVVIGAGIALVMAVFGVTVQPVHAVAPNQGELYVGLDFGKIGHYTNTGLLIETLNSTHGSSKSAGMCFDGSGNLFSAQIQANTVSKFNPAGSLLAANFGTGYNQNPESCAINSAGQIFVGQTGGTHQVRKLDASGNVLATYSPTVGPQGTNWIKLGGGDECTLYYTSGGTLISRFNVCTNSQMSDFATAPSGPCYSHLVRPNGEVMVTCSDAVYRFGPSGNLLQTYSGNSLSPSTQLLVTVNLDPDNTTFWTADGPSRVFRVEIATGLQVYTFPIPSIVGGLAVVGEPRQMPNPAPIPMPTAPALPGPPATGRI